MFHVHDARLAVNCWQIFRRSPKRAVVKSLRACPSSSDLESKCPHVKSFANAIRALSMDAVQKAKSGHPGAPMGMADIAEVLWRDFLKHNPQNPSSG